MPPSPPPRARRALPTVLTLAAVAVLAAGGALWWRENQVSRVRASLPAPPAAVPTPTLGALLGKAQAGAARGSLEAVAELGRLYHANEFRREAEACWRLLIRAQPDEARWHYYLADLLRMTGDQAAVEQQLALTVAADPKAASAWLQLAEMQFKTGRLDAAEAGYARRVELLPNDPYAELGLARIAQLRSRTDETLTRLERLLQQHPKFSAAHNLYAELQAAAGREELADLHRWLGREAGRFREADDPWMEELNARCHEPRRLCHLGVVAYQTGQGDRGKARFEKAIALAPGDPLAYELLGSLLLEQESAATAREVLIRGLDQAKDAAPSPLHFLKLNEACRVLNQPTAAREALTAGLNRYPDSPDLLHAEGNQLKLDGQPAEAAAAYRKALALNPSAVETDFALAILLLETGRREDAVQALNHALSMQPTFPKAMLLLARLEMDAGRFDAAGGHLLRLLKANPGSPEIRQITARWRLQAGRAVERSDPAAAERHYRAGLALQSEHPDLNASLGLQLLIGDRAAEAVPLLEIYQRAQPANPQAALFLGQAYARSGRMPDARRILTDGLRQAEHAGQTALAGHLREILSALR
ncbi:MAG TPA: tetratricopeptide repeat protein [Lacunisphaera sp.]|nr:tetratricopeptide repeat protein [Lacunisphaera sp.]